MPFPVTRYLLPLAALVALAIPAQSAQAASPVVAKAAASHDGSVVTFRLKGIDATKVVGASVVRGSARKPLSVKQVRRAVRKGVLRVRAPRTYRRGGRLRLELRIDREAPVTRIVERPAPADESADFLVGADESPATFTCRLDRGAWKPCGPKVIYGRLAAGEHRFDVRAADRAGNVDKTPVVTTFTVSERPDSQTAAPAAGARAPQRPATGPAARPAGGSSPLVEPNAPILADADAALRVIRSPWEPRSENDGPNRRVPTAAELQAYRADAADWGQCSGYHDRVTGDFTGTTDEIIQWAAWKWGIDVNVFRATAVVESWWRQSNVGDNNLSWGLMSIKMTHQSGTFPLSKDSTAFNADYFGAIIRHYYDGCAGWLNDVDRGREYRAGDLDGALGAWYSGRWHTADATGYVAKVKRVLSERTWEGSDF